MFQSTSYVFSKWFWVATTREKGRMEIW